MSKRKEERGEKKVGKHQKVARKDVSNRRKREKKALRVEERMRCYISLCGLTGPFYLNAARLEKCGTGDVGKAAGPSQLYFNQFKSEIQKNSPYYANNMLYVFLVSTCMILTKK